MIYYDITMTQNIPGWTHLAVAIGIFLFQTLDAIDGKQARRINCSSSLGQLFDHGCDAISWTITNMSVVSFLSLGLTNNAILAIYASIAPFYFTNLLEYYSGVYEYSIGVMDGTTGQMILIIFNLIPFFLGNDFYSWKCDESFPFLPEIMTKGYLHRHYAMIVVVYIGACFSIMLLFKVYNAIEGVKTKIIVTLQLIQHFSLYALMLWFDEDIPFVRNNAAFVYICVIFLYCITTCKLIVCTMSKTKYSIIHYEYLVFGIYFYFQHQYDGSAESESNLKFAFWTVFCIMGLLYFRFTQSCINQISQYLGIYCFSLKPRDSNKEKNA